MGNIRFIRLAEVVNKKQDMRVTSITVKPTIMDCSGTIYFTDLQLQEGSALTGYAPHTEICLKESENAPVWFNGIVRSEETVILLNLGGTGYPPLSETADGRRHCHAGAGCRRPESHLPECHERRRRCGSACIYKRMHKERCERNEVRILSIQCGVGFQTHRIPPAE